MKGRIIVAMSGGKTSAWCGGWALRNFPKEDVILYFNDTKWEHPDLYRFLNDLSNYWKKEITEDSLGISPEELFLQHHALANNRMPFCSRELKALRLQRFYHSGDTLIFGIGPWEVNRAKRISRVYQLVAAKTKKWPKQIIFPLITENVTRLQIDEYLSSIGIREPEMYRLGFQHNNCYGGCVRAGKHQWKHLYDVLPEVYADRERVEELLREKTGKDIHILKDETLKDFRLRIVNGKLNKSYYTEGKTPLTTECVGICNTKS